MAQCALCTSQLNFLNTPSFSIGKLTDGTVCLPCYRKIHKANSNFASKLKSKSLEDVKSLFEHHQTDETENNSRLVEIKKQIEKMDIPNLSSFFGRKEIKELPNILASSETIDNLLQGTYNNGQGILVSTNRRLVFVDKGLLYGLKVEDFPLDKITSIQYETGLMLGKVKIHTSGNIATIDNVDKNSARKFSEFVREKLSQPKEVVSVAQGKPNVLDQLEKLAKLKENGILNEEEFNEQKKKLLDKL